MTDKDVKSQDHSQPQEEPVPPAGKDSIETHLSGPGIRSKRIKWSWIAFSLVAVVALAFILYKAPFSNAQTVASVNGEKISKDDLYQAMVQQAGKQTLDRLITEKLIAQEAAQAKVTVTEEEVKKEFDDFKKSFPSEDQFNMVLAQYGMTEDDLKAQLKTQVQIKKIFEPQITISEADMKKYFEENKDRFSTPGQDDEPTFEEKKEEVKEELFNQQLDKKVPEWIEKIRADAKIENYLEDDITSNDTTKKETASDNETESPDKK